MYTGLPVRAACYTFSTIENEWNQQRPAREPAAAKSVNWNWSLICITVWLSVIALFKRLRVPKRLKAIVEGESLGNDGVAVVVFGLLLAALTFGAAGLVTWALWTRGAFHRAAHLRRTTYRS